MDGWMDRKEEGADTKRRFRRRMDSSESFNPSQSSQEDESILPGKGKWPIGRAALGRLHHKSKRKDERKKKA